MTGVVRTVLGDVPASSLGPTLVHEHLHMDCTSLAAAHGYVPDLAPGEFDLRAAAECRWNPGAHPDNYRFMEHDAVLEDLLDFAELGGGTIVDATPVDLARNPATLARLSQESGLNVVMGTGYYLEATHRPFIPAGDEENASFDLIVGEHDDETAIRPGMIGEIGTSDPPTPGELRSVTGAARAALATGLPLSVHLHPWGDNAERVIDTIGATGLDLDRVLLNHLSTAIGDDERIARILQTGILLSFDLCGFDHSLLGPGRYPPSDDEAMATTAALLAGPHAGQVMISQDVGVRTRLRRYGGWGYGHALRHLVPLLTSHGATTEQVRTLLVENPSRYLTLR
ncbi:phosphotriesterase-related protein [soil metagenome]